MAVALTSRDYQTGYCEFSYDDWGQDEVLIPTPTYKPEGVLSTICPSQGSFAIGTDGTVKILTGDGVWVDY